MMRLVVVESPYAGDIDRNLAYLRACLHDCLLRGEAPFASHAIYTQVGVLDDEKPDERLLGIQAGFAWGDKADATVVYTDLGISEGMKDGIKRAQDACRPVEMRRLTEKKARSRTSRKRSEAYESLDQETLRRLLDEGEEIRRELDARFRSMKWLTAEDLMRRSR